MWWSHPCRDVNHLQPNLLELEALGVVVRPKIEQLLNMGLYMYWWFCIEPHMRQQSTVGQWIIDYILIGQQCVHVHSYVILQANYLKTLYYVVAYWASQSSKQPKNPFLQCYIYIQCYTICKPPVCWLISIQPSV